MTNSPIHILIADDHFVVKSGLKLLLNSYYPDYKITFASHFKEILERLNEQTYNLLILDAAFPEGNSLTVIDKIFVIQPHLKVLLYTGLEENIYASKFFSLGVKGYLSKMAAEEEILSAVRQVLQGGIYMSKDLKETLLDGFVKHNPVVNPFEKLSQREFEIMILMVKGGGNLEISNKLDIKPSTISTYKNRLFEKLGVNNLSELIALYKLHHI